ncbi:hypothetical protein D9M69_590350 [compost metagenome]
MVTAWAGLPEACDRAIDQAWIELAQRSFVQPIARQRAGLVVLKHDVGLLGKLAHDALGLGLVQAQGDGALAAVDSEVVTRFLGVLPIGALEERGAPGAGVIAGTGALNLEDVGAQVRQNLGRPRRCQNAAEVQDLHV